MSPRFFLTVITAGVTTCSRVPVYEQSASALADNLLRNGLRLAASTVKGSMALTDDNAGISYLLIPAEVTHA